MKSNNSLPVPKTVEGLRDAIFDEINAIRRGDVNMARSRAISQLASQAIDSIRVQIQYGRALLLSKSEKPLRLGSDEK